MYLIVIGGGTVGYYLSRHLMERGEEVTLVEKDGKIVTVPVSPAAKVTFNGAPLPLSSLRRGQRATTIRDGNLPADTVEAFNR